MLSNGVTANSDSVAPAPKPAITFAGPETFPSASARKDLYVSKATNPIPIHQHHINLGFFSYSIRIPAFNEFPIISVVHPAYHCFPNGGQGSFCPSGNRRLSCERVLATARLLGCDAGGTWNMERRADIRQDMLLLFYVSHRRAKCGRGYIITYFYSSSSRASYD